MSDQPNQAPKREPHFARVGGFVAVGLVAALAGAWFWRIHIAETLVRGSFARSGTASDLHISSLDISGAQIADLRVGLADKPTFWAKSARLAFDWSFVAPRLHAITLVGGGVRVPLGGGDRGLTAQSPTAQFAAGRLQLPDWQIDARDFHLIGETPLGVFDAVLNVQGNPRATMNAQGRLAPTDMSGARGGAHAVQGDVLITASQGQLHGMLHVSAADAAWTEGANRTVAQVSGLRSSIEFAAPRDMSSALIAAEASADQVQGVGIGDARMAQAKTDLQIGPIASNFVPETIGGAYALSSARTTIGGTIFDGASASGGYAKDSEISLRARRGKDTKLALDHGRVTLGVHSSANIAGAATISAPLAGLQFIDARAPLDLTLDWGAGLRLQPSNGACIPVAAARVEAPGVTFINAGAQLCTANGGPLFTADPQHHLSGGFALDHLNWSGQMSGGEPARLVVDHIDGALSGDDRTPILDFRVAAPAFGADYPQKRALRVSAAAIAGRLTTGKAWALTGNLQGGIADDSSLPGRLTDFDAAWTGAPDRRGNGVFKIAQGHGRAFASGASLLFHPLVVQQVKGAFQNGRLVADGALALADAPTQKLGVFTIKHDTNNGVGEANVAARQFAFNTKLQPYDVSELARGVVDNARGPVDVDLTAHWTPRATSTDGRVVLDDMSFDTAALGPVTGASGTIILDDLNQMTTPQHQKLHVASINPGIVLQNGDLLFQLQDHQRLTIENAHAPFAKGLLSVEPVTLTLGADETRLSVALTDIDVAALTTELNIKGLTATGTARGRFPLIFTPTKGRIENGRLEAGPGGGSIAYQGDVGAKAGPAQVAFDALRSFRYDSLSIDLNGDLDGEIVSAIHFTGKNVEPMNPSGSVIPIKVAGIPFKFTVTVQAPFRALAQNAEGFGDATQYLRDIKAEEGALPPAEEPPR